MTAGCTTTATWIGLGAISVFGIAALAFLAFMMWLDREETHYRRRAQDQAPPDGCGAP